MRVAAARDKKVASKEPWSSVSAKGQDHVSAKKPGCKRRDNERDEKRKRVLWMCGQQHKSSQKKIKERQKEMRGTICVYIYTLCTCVIKI